MKEKKDESRNFKENEIRIHFEDYPYEVDKSRLNLPLSERPSPEEVASHLTLDRNSSFKKYARTNVKRRRSLHSRSLEDWKHFEVKRLSNFKLELKTIYDRMFFIETEQESRERNYKDKSRAVNLYFIHLGAELRKIKARAKKLEKYLEKVTKKKIEEKWDVLIKEKRNQ